MAVRLLFVAALLAPLPATAQARILGSDAQACIDRDGPAIQATITGLKDRTGGLKLELYPATEADFLKDDHGLLAAGKTFRRVRSPVPAAGTITMCIKVPRPGRYALFFTHDRDGKNKFDVWNDGAGVPSNRKLGRSRPTVDQAIVTVGQGVAQVSIRAQYLRGLIPSFGFVGRGG